MPEPGGQRPLLRRWPHLINSTRSAAPPTGGPGPQRRGAEGRAALRSEDPQGPPAGPLSPAVFIHLGLYPSGPGSLEGLPLLTARAGDDPEVPGLDEQEAPSSQQSPFWDKGALLGRAQELKEA